jgi:hypothetical protein
MQPAHWWKKNVWSIISLAAAVSDLNSQGTRATRRPLPICWKNPKSAGRSKARGCGRLLAMPGRYDDGGSYA